MRDRMHIIVPASIIFVLLIPALIMVRQYYGDRQEKVQSTQFTLETVIGRVDKNDDGSFNVPANIEDKDAWGTEIRLEVKTEKARGIHIFKKLTAISAGADKQFGTRDDITVTKESTLKR